MRQWSDISSGYTKSVPSEGNGHVRRGRTRKGSVTYVVSFKYKKDHTTRLVINDLDKI